jgi:hypothetical protein
LKKSKMLKKFEPIALQIFFWNSDTFFGVNHRIGRRTCLKQVSKLAYADIFMLITKKTFKMPDESGFFWQLCCCCCLKIVNKSYLSWKRVRWRPYQPFAAAAVMDKNCSYRSATALPDCSTRFIYDRGPGNGTVSHPHRT